jgi:hypothetical protein
MLILVEKCKAMLEHVITAVFALNLTMRYGERLLRMSRLRNSWTSAGF